MSRNIALVFALAMLSAAAAGHEHATGIAAERMSLMEEIGKDMNAILALLKRRSKPEQVLAHAKKLLERSDRWKVLI